MIRIKKYGNRRLYNTETSRYVNLEELAALIRGGETVEVADATSGADLTRDVLLQIVLEAQGGASLFPTGLLHRVIRAQGEHPAQRLLLSQLGTALSLMETQLAAMEERFPWMRAAGTPWSGQAPPPKETPPPPEAPPEEAAESASTTGAPEDPELAALRARLAGLEARLKGRGGARS